MEGLPAGERQGEEAAVGGVEETEAVEARLYFDVGPYLAIFQDAASEELSKPKGVRGRRSWVEELAVGGELAVVEQQRNLVFARGEVEGVLVESRRSAMPKRPA